MAISIAMHAFNPQFNRYTKTADGKGIKVNSASGGGGLVHHIERDAQTAQDAAESTNSMLNTALTQYNEQFIAPQDSYDNLDKAQKLVAERVAAHSSNLVDPVKLADANKAKESARRKWKRYEKKNKPQAKIDAAKAAFDQAKSDYDALKSSGSLDKWSKDVGVGQTGTVQISKDALAHDGWQFKRHDNGQHITNVDDVDGDSKAFSIEEQMEYEAQHPDCKGIDNVKFSYRHAANAMLSHPERYGSMISMALHLDEKIPHVDYMALGIGQNLDGSWVDGHVGSKDNGTDHQRENIRARTYINGRNGLQDKQWSSHIQDQFSTDIEEELATNVYSTMPDAHNHAADVIDTLGLHRGTPKKLAIEEMRQKIGQTDNALSSANSMQSQAAIASANAKSIEDAMKSNSIKADREAAAQLASDKASLAAKYRSAFDSQISSMSTSYNDSFNAMTESWASSANVDLADYKHNTDDSLKSSYATSFARIQESLTDSADNVASIGYSDGFIQGSSAGSSTLKSANKALAASKQAYQLSVAAVDKSIADGISSANESLESARSEASHSVGTAIDSINASFAAANNSIVTATSSIAIMSTANSISSSQNSHSADSLKNKSKTMSQSSMALASSATSLSALQADLISSSSSINAAAEYNTSVASSNSVVADSNSSTFIRVENLNLKATDRLTSGRQIIKQGKAMMDAMLSYANPTMAVDERHSLIDKGYFQNKYGTQVPIMKYALSSIDKHFSSQAAISPSWAKKNAAPMSNVFQSLLADTTKPSTNSTSSSSSDFGPFLT